MSVIGLIICACTYYLVIAAWGSKKARFAAREIFEIIAAQQSRLISH
jgi:hypothetical protein